MHLSLCREVIGTSLTVPLSVKAHELYQSHLDQFPPKYGTKEAYDRSLTELATSIEVYIDTRLLHRKETSISQSMTQARKKVPVAVSFLAFTVLGGDGLSESFYADRRKHFRDRFGAWEALYRRSLFALLGGFALVVPMLVMKLYPTTLNVCLTTTLFVIVGALLLAIFMTDTEPKDVLGMTAAYAAVLVVFVGTSTTAAGGNDRKVAIVTGSIAGTLGLVMCVIALYLGRLLYLYNSMLKSSN